jgi:hypothetical protein
LSFGGCGRRQERTCENGNPESSPHRPVPPGTCYSKFAAKAEDPIDPQNLRSA